MSPLSTKLPLHPSSPGAMNFSLWQTLGSEMLLRSDLINWYVCKDGSGSILKWKEGSISCRVVKSLVPKCNNTAPSRFKTSLNFGLRLETGPRYYGSKLLYLVAVMGWSSYIEYKVDACGNHNNDIVKGLSNPRGAWFVR